MDAFIEWCVSRDDCALGTDAEGAQERIADLLDDVERAPLETSRGDIDSIGEGWLGFAIFMCLYSKESWPTLNEGLAQALDGRGDILLAHAMNVVGRSARGVRHLVLPAGHDPRAMRGLVTEQRRRARGAVQRRARTEHPLWSQLTGLLYDNCGTWPGEVRKPSGTTLAEGPRPSSSSATCGPGDAHRGHEAARRRPRLRSPGHQRRRAWHLLRWQLVRGLHRRRLPRQGDGAPVRPGLLSAIRRGGVVIASLAVLVAFATMEPADPEGSVERAPAQRHTASSTATATAGEIRFTAPPDPNPPGLRASTPSRCGGSSVLTTRLRLRVRHGPPGPLRALRADRRHRPASAPCQIGGAQGDAVRQPRRPGTTAPSSSRSRRLRRRAA